MVKFPTKVKKSKSNGKQIVGIAAGAALIGAVGTALFTPKAGKEVRKDIVSGGKKATQEVENTVKTLEKKLHKSAKKPVVSTKVTTTTAKPAKKTPAKTTRATKTPAAKTK